VGKLTGVSDFLANRFDADVPIFVITATKSSGGAMASREILGNNR